MVIKFQFNVSFTKCICVPFFKIGKEKKSHENDSTSEILSFEKYSFLEEGRR